MLKAQWSPYRLLFRFEARTSRASMFDKDTYFIRLFDSSDPATTLGIGECALFRGLSEEDKPDYEEKLSLACQRPEDALVNADSSIKFGFETAFKRINPSQPWIEGRRGIATNGLIWMGDKATMARRIDEKLENGFRVLKLKIGGISFEDEVDLLKSIRQRYSPSTLELRLDANGSFSPEDAMRKLDILSSYSIHSLEQPIKAGQTCEMASICRQSPIPIGLDEELIGTRTYNAATELVEYINPQYLILKPSLCGGFAAADNYIDIAHKLGIGWWCTSALESNIGLAAIAAWVSSKGVEIPQGLGTGQLYHNNVPSPLEMRGESLFYNANGTWQFPSDMPWRN